jgi:hypothetical protein
MCGIKLDNIMTGTRFTVFLPALNRNGESEPEYIDVDLCENHMQGMTARGIVELALHLQKGREGD